jgi:hypothetical protein
MSIVKIDYYGVEGQGRNVTEAKKDAGAKIKAGMTGDCQPYVICWRGWAKIVYFDPRSGYCDAMLREGDTGVMRVGSLYGRSCGPDAWDRKVIIQRAAAHVLQCGWAADDCEKVPADFPIDIGAPAEREHASWARWQIRYQEARTAGLGDNDAHDYAGRNPARPELWKTDLTAA